MKVNNKVRDRLRTQRILLERRAKFGVYHPATFAAYGRAFVAWDGGIRPPEISNGGVDTFAELTSAYTRSQLRAYGDNGYGNQLMRRYWSGLR